jgi:mevalonyl-CoA ligase
LLRSGLLNNAQFVGDYLHLTEKDVVCCPPPLFHCFGLVAGLLAAYTHGTTMAYANRDFDAAAVVDVLLKERCTVLHGVPTMFTAIMQHMASIGAKIDTLRTGIAAGSKVPPALLMELQQRLGFQNVAVAYGK